MIMNPAAGRWRLVSPPTALVTGGLVLVLMALEFAGRLKDAVDLDAVQADLAAVVRTALEPAQVSVWISGGAAP